jgi:transposase
MPKFRTYDQRQSVIRQLVPAQLLEEDHPARIVDAVVERLDLEQIYACYKEEGKPAYHPKMMLKVLFYSYLIGVMSSRKMEAGLDLRADYVFLSGDQVPDFQDAQCVSHTAHGAATWAVFPDCDALFGLGDGGLQEPGD